MEQKPPKELRLNAYYFGFSPTGQRVIDEILSSVACAGKGYHHTESWGDNECCDLGLSFKTEGKSYAQVIQDAAIEAANAYDKLKRDRDALLEAAIEIVSKAGKGRGMAEFWNDEFDDLRAAIAQAAKED